MPRPNLVLAALTVTRKAGWLHSLSANAVGMGAHEANGAQENIIYTGFK
jgi:hypothetical protein